MEDGDKAAFLSGSMLPVLKGTDGTLSFFEFVGYCGISLNPDERHAGCHNFEIRSHFVRHSSKVSGRCPFSSVEATKHGNESSNASPNLCHANPAYDESFDDFRWHVDTGPV